MSSNWLSSGVRKVRIMNTYLLSTLHLNVEIQDFIISFYNQENYAVIMKIAMTIIKRKSIEETKYFKKLIVFVIIFLLSFLICVLILQNTCQFMIRYNTSS